MIQRWSLVTALCLAVACDTGAATGDPPPAADGASNRLALVIAIADYDDATGWDDLSADRDLEILTPALEAQRFRVVSLTDGDATREGIEGALREELIAAARPGTLAYVHYSGHGHRITDDDGDEEDGYDEVLVPHDAPANPPAGYDGGRHLRDDRLDELLRELRRKVGPDGEVVVSIDACFSGTGTRGEAPVRGRATPIGPPASGAARGTTDAGGGYLETHRSRGAAVGEQGLAPIVAFSASRHDELAWEAQDDDGYLVGSLSLAISRALAEVEPGETYRALFERLRNRMAAFGVSNTPQAEGALDAALFQGEAIAQDPYFRVGRLNDDGDRLTLEAGSVMGLFSGTRVAIVPAGTLAWRETEPVTAGEIVSVTPLSSVVAIDPAVYEEDVANAWAYVTAPSFGPVGIAVRLDGDAGSLRPALEAAIEESETRLVSIDDDADVVVRRVDGRWSVETTTDGRVLSASDRAPAAAELLAHLQDYARNRYLRRLDLDSESLAVTVDVEPCTVACDDFGNCTCEPPGAARREGGNLVMPEGTGYRMTLANQGSAPAFLHVLELMPDGRWDVLWPRRNQTPVPVAAGERFTPPPIWQVGPPYGDNVLKVFASRTPIDFQWLLGSRQRTRGAGNPLEALFEEAMTPATRGSTARTTIAADGGVATAALTFQIVE